MVPGVEAVVVVEYVSSHWAAFAWEAPDLRA